MAEREGKRKKSSSGKGHRKRHHGDDSPNRIEEARPESESEVDILDNTDERPKSSESLRMLTLGSISEEIRCLGKNSQARLTGNHAKEKIGIFLNALVVYSTEVSPYYWEILTNPSTGVSKSKEITIDPKQITNAMMKSKVREQEGQFFIKSGELNWYRIWDLMKKEFEKYEEIKDVSKFTSAFQQVLHRGLTVGGTSGDLGRIILSLLIKLFDARFKRDRPSGPARVQYIEDDIINAYYAHKSKNPDSKWDRKLALEDSLVTAFHGALSELRDADKLEEKVETDNEEEVERQYELQMPEVPRFKSSIGNTPPCTNEEALKKLMKDNEQHTQDLLFHTKKVVELTELVNKEESQMELLKTKVLEDNSRASAIEEISHLAPKGPEYIAFMQELPELVDAFISAKQAVFPELDHKSYKNVLIDALRLHKATQQSTQEDLRNSPRSELGIPPGVGADVDVVEEAGEVDISLHENVRDLVHGYTSNEFVTPLASPYSSEEGSTIDTDNVELGAEFNVPGRVSDHPEAMENPSDTVGTPSNADMYSSEEVPSGLGVEDLSHNQNVEGYQAECRKRLTLAVASLTSLMEEDADE